MEEVKSFILNLSLSHEQLYLFMLSFSLWWVVYSFVHFFVKINNKTLLKILDTKNRIVSIIHGSYCIFASFIDIFINKTDKCGYENSDFQNTFMLISCSYFLYDMIACIVLKISNLPMFFHHMSCIFGMYTSVYYNSSATEIIRAILVAEVTNPIMHLREIFKNYDLGKTKFYLLLDLIFMGLYIISRLVFGLPVIMLTVFCEGNLILVKITGAFIWLQSVFFTYKMISILKFRYAEYKERSEKNIQLWWFEHNKQIDDMEVYKKKAKTYVP